MKCGTTGLKLWTALWTILIITWWWIIIPVFAFQNAITMGGVR